MALVEVYRSDRRADCDERSLVLAAVGVASELVWLGDSFALLVPEESIITAATHLKDYEEESSSREPEPTPISVHPDAWLGSAGYAVVLVSVSHCAAGGLLGIDWFSSGELVSGLVRRGELWRLVTALTLHADPSHLLTNIGSESYSVFSRANYSGQGSPGPAFWRPARSGIFSTHCSCRQPIAYSAHRPQYSRRLVSLVRTHGVSAQHALHAGPTAGRH